MIGVLHCPCPVLYAQDTCQGVKVHSVGGRILICSSFIVLDLVLASWSVLHRQKVN